jgi:hypothetical protein
MDTGYVAAERLIALSASTAGRAYAKAFADVRATLVVEAQTARHGDL